MVNMKSNALPAFAWSDDAEAPQLFDPACEWERRELLELGENIIAQTPSAWPRFQSWMTAVRRLSDDVCTAFTPEAALTSLSGELRRLWMQTTLERLEREGGVAPVKPAANVRLTSVPRGLYLAHSRDADARPDALEGRCP